MLGVGLAELHVGMRRPDRALDAIERTLERYPRFWYVRLVRAQALEQLGRHHEALQEFVEAERATPDSFPVVSSIVGALAATGKAREARRRVAKVERLARSTFVPAFELGLMRVALGDIDLAFDWLRRSCDIKEPRLTGIGFHHGVDPIRQDPRFAELLACVGLPVNAASSR
jgi:tetratricopeptide (TPR) repeat protein